MPDLGRPVHHIDDLDSPGDRPIAELAARQHGVVARRQLIELGFGRGAIDRRRYAGRLHRVHRGVYAVGHPRLVGRGRWIAAVLACGSEALLSHRSAAALWGLRPNIGSVVDVTAGRSHAGERGIRVHRVRALDPEDRATRDGIPVTTVPRTLLDLGETVSPTQLQRAFEEAERLGLLDMRAIERLRDRSRGRRGLRSLLALLDAHRGPPPMTRSELERRFLDLCRDAGLPPPIVNATAAGMEVDMLWPRQRLVVELDGHAFHRTRAAFERDRVRDAALQRAGHRVLRVTDRRLSAEPAAVIETVESLFGLSG
jgi:Transcriptional regulator, AbiEi antitoxin/Protein of unknown function (DUF559)